MSRSEVRLHGISAEINSKPVNYCDRRMDEIKAELRVLKTVRRVLPTFPARVAVKDVKEIVRHAFLRGA